MNNLLIFFAFPVATIIFAIALQKILKSPFLVSAVTFAVYLIATFVAFDEDFLVFAILYSLLAFLTALITRFLCCIIKNSNNPCIRSNLCESDNSENEGDSDEIDDNSNCGNNLPGCGCNRNYANPYWVRRNMFRR